MDTNEWERIKAEDSDKDRLIQPTRFDLDRLTKAYIVWVVLVTLAVTVAYAFSKLFHLWN
jgi:hypothetical protein